MKKQNNLNGNYESSLNDWVVREKYANEFINVLYKLFYDKSIELVLFRSQLIDRSASLVLTVTRMLKTSPTNHSG